MNEQRPTVSVVIPCHNYGRYLGQAIDSVLAQTVKPLEILVADDGSTDDTAEVVARYGNAVKYRKFDHCGVCAIRQVLLDEPKGEWFLNLDADNWIEPDFLEKALKIVASHSDDETFAFVYPDIQCFGDTVGLKKFPDFDPAKLKHRNYLDMNSLVRLKAARMAGFETRFSIAGMEDYDFFLTLVKMGFWGERLPGGLMHYRVHTGGLRHTVVRKFRQRKITRHILLKHKDFFTREEAKAAMASASNQTLVALVGSRTPFAGFGQRLSDWLLFARVGWRHLEFRKQTVYCFFPRRFFESQAAPAEVFYLFRDTEERRQMVRRVMEGGKSGLEGGQLFGFEELWKKGTTVDCNLRFPRVGSVRETVQGWIERRYAPRTGVGLGDTCSVCAHMWQINRARVAVTTSDNMGMPAARLKARGRLKVSLVYVSIGLPERLKAVEARSPARAARYRKRLASVDCFIAYGHAETEELRQWIGDSANVRFIPFGVDTAKWRPADASAEVVDVLSIGADPMRDFKLLAEYARRHPAVGVSLVTGRECAAELGPLPTNMQVRIRVPIEELKELIAGARVVVLPVKDNTYSGATTTLLQCMAMGKAVAVSRVGAIREGYGFQDGVNVRWIEPGSLESLSAAVAELLADGGLRRRLGTAARQHVVENLGWGRYINEIEKCLAEWMEWKREDSKE